MRKFLLLRIGFEVRVIVSTSAVCSASLWALSLGASHLLRSDFEQQLGEQQFSAVCAAAADIDEGLSDWLLLLRKVSADFTPDVQGESRSLQKSLDHRPMLGVCFNDRAFMVDKAGAVLAYAVMGPAELS